MNLENLLKSHEIHSSAPCRVDMGGTLDIITFYLPLQFLSPSSVNIAIDMRTSVALSSYKKGYVKVSSRGFESAEFQSFKAHYDHPMGLMFALADYFNVHGVHIKIDSSSPPRSALGGSSSAAAAITAALLAAVDIHEGIDVDPARYTEKAAWIAHYVESSVAGVPCGMQDQLAAAFGGINQWFWSLGENGRPAFSRNALFDDPGEVCGLNKSILVAYCGIPHVSSEVNKIWVDRFICGENRDKFENICQLTDKFAKAFKANDFLSAGRYMNQETAIRLEMTPHVLDPVGKRLFNKALEMGVGARFTGAGGGGCVWAVGSIDKIKDVKPVFAQILEGEKEAGILDARIDLNGIDVHIDG